MYDINMMVYIMHELYAFFYWFIVNYKKKELYLFINWLMLSKIHYPHSCIPRFPIHRYIGSLGVSLDKCTFHYCEDKSMSEENLCIQQYVEHQPDNSQNERQKLLEKQLSRLLNAQHKRNYMTAIQEVITHLNIENNEGMQNIEIILPSYIFNTGKYKDSVDQINHKLFELQKKLDVVPPYIHRALIYKYGELVDKVKLEIHALNISDTCASLVTAKDIEWLKDFWFDD